MKMPKKIEEKAEEVVVEAEKPSKNVSDREARWESYVENYIKENPVKGAEKKKRGEFDKVPVSFK